MVFEGFDISRFGIHLGKVKSLGGAEKRETEKSKKGNWRPPEQSHRLG